MNRKRSFGFLMMALHELEQELNLTEHSQNEKLVLASIILLTEKNDGIANIDLIKRMN